MKKGLIILLSLNIVFGMSSKWNLITNETYPLVKFKFAKSFIEERIGPKNFPRGTFVGKTNRQKYIDDDGYYRFSVRALIFTNGEGNILQDISIAEADKLVNPFYRHFNKRNVVLKNLTSIDQFEEFLSSDGFKDLFEGANKYGINKYLKESKKMRIIKAFAAFKYKEGIFITFKMKRIDPINGDRIVIAGSYLIKKNGKWQENVVNLGWGTMASNIDNFIQMVQGDFSQITTTDEGRSGYSYPLVDFN